MAWPVYIYQTGLVNGVLMKSHPENWLVVIGAVLKVIYGRPNSLCPLTRGCIDHRLDTLSIGNAMILVLVTVHYPTLYQLHITQRINSEKFEAKSIENQFFRNLFNNRRMTKVHDKSDIELKIHLYMYILSIRATSWVFMLSIWKKVFDDITRLERLKSCCWLSQWVSSHYFGAFLISTILLKVIMIIACHQIGPCPSTTSTMQTQLLL